MLIAEHQWTRKASTPLLHATTPPRWITERSKSTLGNTIGGFKLRAILGQLVKRLIQYLIRNAILLSCLRLFRMPTRGIDSDVSSDNGA